MCGAQGRSKPEVSLQLGIEQSAQFGDNPGCLLVRAALQEQGLVPQSKPGCQIFGKNRSCSGPRKLRQIRFIGGAHQRLNRGIYLPRVV